MASEPIQPAAATEKVAESETVISHPERNVSTTSHSDVDEEKAAAGSPLDRIDTTDFPTAFPLAMICMSLMLAMFLVALDMTIVGTAIPAITDEFHSLDQVGWYGSAFFLTIAAFQSAWGKGYKYFPLKTTFLLSMFIFEVGSLICGVAQSSTTLIAGRAIAGWGGGGLASGVYTIIAFSAPPAKRPAFTGLLGAVWGVAAVLGPLIGGAFTTHVTWRWCFYINLPIGGLSAVAVAIFFKTPAAAKPQEAPLKEKILQMDLPGSFMLLAAVVCYLLAIQWGGVSKAWSDSDVVGVLIGFGLMLITFLAIEWYQKDRAMLQFQLLKDRTIGTMCVYVSFTGAVFFIMLYYLPIYFQTAKNVSASKSGIDNLPLVVGVSLFSIVSGGLITAFGHYIPIMIFGSIVATVGAGVTYTLDIDSPSSQWIGYQALLGIGLGLTVQIPVIVNQTVVPPSEISSITAMTLFFQTICGALFLSAAQAGFTNKIVERIPQTVPGLSPQTVIATGATELRATFSEAQIPGVLRAYMDGITVTLLIALIFACLSCAVAVLPRWEKLRVKPGAGAA